MTLVVRFADKLQLKGEILEVEGYEWAIIGTFMVTVPGAFLVCTAITIRESREKQPMEMRDTTQMRFTTESLSTSLLGSATTSIDEPEPDPE